MAFNHENPTSILVFSSVVSSLLISHSSCLSPKLLANTHGGENGFLPALGTWYGDPKGTGSGGACGWGDDVKSPPFSAMIAARNAKIYLHGKGCGDCYQIKCNRRPYCSGKPIIVTITDECLGACDSVPFHFDLSGTAFGAMASPGQADNLRDLGQVDIQYQRVLCNYGSTMIAFKIIEKTNPNRFATAVEFLDGLGELQSVKIAPAGSKNFVPMHKRWGAVWSSYIDPSFHGPFSFLLKSPMNKAITANNVVPSNFVPGQTYHSNVNF